MVIKIIEPKGYCAGVNNAISIAYQAKKEHPDKNIYVLGMLVHNNFVIDNLNKQNIFTVHDIDEIPNDNVVIFTAHGHDEKLNDLANKKKLLIYDAVCPIVKNNLNIIKKELSQGHQVIFIGIKNHPETIAATSISDDVFLYDIQNGFDYSLLKDDSPLIVNQTTLNILDLKSIHQAILKQVCAGRINDEICSATRRRQEAVKNIDESIFDLIVVVGDKQSSNSFRLFEVARASHPTVESIMISSEKDLSIKQIENKKGIAIVSGASVPNEIIDALYNKIKKLFK